MHLLAYQKDEALRSCFDEKNLNPFLELRKRTLHLQSQTEGAIAQSVEQRTENPCVPGSNPGGTTSKSLSEMKGFFDLMLSVKIPLSTILFQIELYRCSSEFSAISLILSSAFGQVFSK